MSISNEEYVKTLEELFHSRNQEQFEALYPAIEQLLIAEKEYQLLTKVYMWRALMYYQFSNIEEMVKFLSKHFTLFRKYATDEDFMRYKNARAIALEMNGYYDGFYEQMLEIKAYGEEHHNESLVVNAITNIGLLKTNTGQNEEAIRYFHEAYVITKAKKDTNVKMFNDHYLAINNLFATYLQMEDLESAAHYLHLEEPFRKCYSRYDMLYRTNVAKYYAAVNQFDEAKRRLALLRAEIEADPAKVVYYSGVLECECTIAKRTGDLQLEKIVYKQLITIQKKSKQDRLLQLIMQSSHQSARHELIEASQCDSLTKLWNRRGFIHQTELVKRTNRDSTYVVCAMLDIDYFKQINDRYGHLAGDQVICQVAEVLKKYEQHGFVCARYGGDEFILTFLENDEQRITDKVAELYSELQQTIFSYNGVMIPVTLTMGVVYVVKNETCPVEKLLSLADCAMYEVKHNGRAYYVVKCISQKEVV
ncbi:MAG: GGDEF domain-containing protein [Caryophanon sp.]|nr:GGDEF domain-containing protein [Caryophanon sp.]